MSILKRTQRKYVKKAYRVRNWREYEAGLRNRGSLTVWISLTAGKLVNWDAPRPRRRKPGRQRKCQRRPKTAHSWRVKIAHPTIG